jgi:hypothetical protein
MFLITWMFDKLGYIPKIDMQIGKVNIEAAWPFPVGEEEKPKATVKKRKPVVKKATTVAKKAK